MFICSAVHFFLFGNRDLELVSLTLVMLLHNTLFAGDWHNYVTSPYHTCGLWKQFIVVY